MSDDIIKQLLPRVAFSVALDYEMEPSNEYRVIKYNVVLVNTDGVYNANTGVFTAPSNGTYLFGFHAVSYHGFNVLMHIIKNGQRVLSAFGSSGCGCCSSADDVRELECAGAASNVGMMTLTEHDNVWVELASLYGLHNAPYHNYATFYGHLLFAEISGVE